MNPDAPISPAQRLRESCDERELTLAQRVIARELSERGADHPQAVGLMLDAMGRMFRAVARDT